MIGSGLMSGLSNFASSGLGQTVIGAGLGYGADRLMGGQGGVGAVLGGLGGGLNAWDSGAGLLEGGNFADSAIGGLWGGTPTQNKVNMNYAPTGNVMQDLAIRQPVQAEQLGLMDSLSGYTDNVADFGGKYKDTVSTVSDMFKGYGDFTAGLAQQENYQNEMDYRNKIANYQLAEADFKKNAQLANQANINSAFGSSEFSKPSNYYTT